MWYEKWINNYIKLPWNLTMQINQGWEFTNIWWLFLALIPILFLFLSYRRKWLEYVILPILFLWTIYFVDFQNHLIWKEDLKNLDKNVISKIFTKNTNIFKNKSFEEDIYEINCKKYILNEKNNRTKKCL